MLVQTHDAITVSDFEALVERPESQERVFKFVGWDCPSPHSLSIVVTAATYVMTFIRITPPHEDSDRS